MLGDVHWSSSKTHSEKKKSKVLSVTDDWLTAFTSKNQRIKGAWNCITGAKSVAVHCSMLTRENFTTFQPFQ